MVVWCAPPRLRTGEFSHPIGSLLPFDAAHLGSEPGRAAPRRALIETSTPRVITVISLITITSPVTLSARRPGSGSRLNDAFDEALGDEDSPKASLRRSAAGPRRAGAAAAGAEHHQALAVEVEVAVVGEDRASRACNVGRPALQSARAGCTRRPRRTSTRRTDACSSGPERVTARCTGCSSSYRRRISRIRASARTHAPSGPVTTSAAVRHPRAPAAAGRTPPSWLVDCLRGGAGSHRGGARRVHHAGDRGAAVYATVAIALELDPGGGAVGAESDLEDFGLLSHVGEPPWEPSQPRRLRQ